MQMTSWDPLADHPVAGLVFWASYRKGPMVPAPIVIDQIIPREIAQTIRATMDSRDQMKIGRGKGRRKCSASESSRIHAETRRTGNGRFVKETFSVNALLRKPKTWNGQ